MISFSRVSLPRVAQCAPAIAVIAILLQGCSESTAPDPSGTFFGPVTTMTAGSGRSFIVLDRTGAPTELGITFSESTLSALPVTRTDFVFALPAEASATPFKHAVINWEPVGHGAMGTVYAVPHFDVHFYCVSEAERAAIVLGDSASTAKMTRQPALEFIPPDYVAATPSIAMGMHWNDPTAPERNGQPFTYTFIYGSYDGAFIFSEPMVTKAFLDLKQPLAKASIKLPAQYAFRGYQPTAYSVSYDAVRKEYRVALTELVMR